MASDVVYDDVKEQNHTKHNEKRIDEIVCREAQVPKGAIKRDYERGKKGFTAHGIMQQQVPKKKVRQTHVPAGACALPGTPTKG